MRIFFTILLIVFGLNLFAQNNCTFSYLIDSKVNNSFATGQYLLPNGNFLLTYSSYDGKVGFVEMEESGKVINEFSYSFYPGTNNGDFEQIKNILFDQNGNIYGFGNELSGFIKKGFVFKLDKNYQLLQLKYIEDICFLDMEWNANNDLKLFCLSPTVNRNESFVMNLSKNDFSLLSNSQIVTYDNLYDHHEYSLKTNSGYITSGGYDYSYFNGNQVGVVSFVSENDNISWSISPFSHLSQFSKQYSHKIIETANEFIISGIGITKSDTTKRILVASIDKNGTKTNWIKSIQLIGSRNPNLTSFIAHDNGFLLAGSSDNISDIDIFAIALDNNGNVKWRRSYGQPNGKEIISYSNIISKNNHLYFYLNTNSFSSGNKLWWFNTNNQGTFNLNSNCSEVKDLNIDVLDLITNITPISYKNKSITFEIKSNSSNSENIAVSLDTICTCLSCKLSSNKFADTLKYEFGDTLMINPNIIGAYQGAKIFWSFDNGDTSCVTNDCKQLKFIPKCSTPCICSNGILKYIVKDSLGCTLTDSTFIKNKKELSDIVQIPNVFTPNSDKTNDVFTAVPKDKGCMKRIKLIRIFNRWGKVVYQDVDLNDGDFTTGWDGTSDLNGEELNSDIFTYQIEVELTDHSTKVFKGEVLLVR